MIPPSFLWGQGVMDYLSNGQTDTTNTHSRVRKGCNFLKFCFCCLDLPVAVTTTPHISCMGVAMTVSKGRFTEGHHRQNKNLKDFFFPSHYPKFMKNYLHTFIPSYLPNTTCLSNWQQKFSKKPKHCDMGCIYSTYSPPPPIFTMLLFGLMSFFQA